MFEEVVILRKLKNTTLKSTVQIPGYRTTKLKILKRLNHIHVLISILKQFLGKCLRLKIKSIYPLRFLLGFYFCQTISGFD